MCVGWVMYRRASATIAPGIVALKQPAPPPEEAAARHAALYETDIMPTDSDVVDEIGGAEEEPDPETSAQTAAREDGPDVYGPGELGPDVIRPRLDPLAQLGQRLLGLLELRGRGHVAIPQRPRPAGAVGGGRQVHLGRGKRRLGRAGGVR